QGVPGRALHARREDHADLRGHAGGTAARDRPRDAEGVTRVSAQHRLNTPWYDAVDRRPLAAELPWPDLAGKRCLDIGTADGFWALEMERRGAADVLATDVGTPFARSARARFETVESNVRYEDCSVYDLEGEYDIAFMGWA